VNATVGLRLPASSLAVHDTVVGLALTGNMPVCTAASFARKVRGLPTKAPMQLMVGSGVTLSVAVMLGKATGALSAPAAAVPVRAVAPVMASVGVTASGVRHTGEGGGQSN
jgi:hypothetical protein